MLALERKKTDKIDFGKPLQQYVRNQYSAQAAQDLEEAFNTVQQLREDVRNIQDKNDATRELIQRYEFLFLGMILLKAGKQNRSSEEGLKIACQNFQSAAGVFQELKEELEKHPQPGIVDLTPECISMFINLMLAQAQECFYEKAIKGGTNPSIVCKLAAQAAEFYEVTQQMMNLPAISGAIQKTWVAYVALKISMFKANSHYYLSIALGKSDEYGQQVARLKVALNLLEDGKKHLRSVPSDLQQIFNTVVSQVGNAFTTAEKENDTIYHDKVPAEVNLTPLEKKVIVKAIPLPENVKLGQKDPFYTLIPFAVTQKLSTYQERKDSLVRNELRSIDEQNQLAIGMLSSMNLPGAIDALETSGGLPPGLEEKMKAVKSDGGARFILELVETLNKLAEENASMLDKAVQTLDKEEKDDESMRSKYSTAWNRTPSHTLTANLRQEAAKFKGNIDHARKSDSYVLKKFQDHQQFIVKLNGSQQDVVSILPNNKDASGALSPFVQSLKQSLTLLDRVIAQRAQIRDQFMSLSQSDDITSRLLSTSQNDEEVYTTELAKYGDLQTKIQDSFKQQSDLLNRIQQDNTQFIANKQSGNPNAQREQILQQLTTAFKVFNELKSNLSEGIQFYTNFQDILRQFLRKCEDFTFARDTEKADLIRELEKPQTSSNVPQGSQGFNASSAYSQQTKPSTQSQTSGVLPGQWQPNMQPVYQQPLSGAYQPPFLAPSAPTYQPPTNPSLQSFPYQQPPTYQQPPPTYQLPPTYQQPASPYQYQQGYQQPPYSQAPLPNQQGYQQPPYSQAQLPNQQGSPYGAQSPYNTNQQRK